MSTKIRCIYIDGMDKTGKTSVVREIRKYLKEKEKDLYEINGTDQDKLKLQDILLQENSNSLILKENSLISLFNDELKKGSGIISLEKTFEETIRKERDINQKYGSIHFLLIPEELDFLVQRSDQEYIPKNLAAVHEFFKNISYYGVSQGLNIETILFNEDDKIYDIRDKILNIIKEKYLI